jgi:hypothetical protein
MPDLSVDLTGLRTLSSTLSGVRGSLDATRDVIEASRDDLGSAEVYDALDSFESNWDDGRGQIDKNMQAMIEILDESADAYEQTDQELANGLNESMSGGSS